MYTYMYMFCTYTQKYFHVMQFTLNVVYSHIFASLVKCFGYSRVTVCERQCLYEAFSMQTKERMLLCGEFSRQLVNMKEPVTVHV